MDNITDGNGVTDVIISKLVSASCKYELLEHQSVFTMEDVEQYIPVPFASRVKTMVIAVKSPLEIEPILCGLPANSRLDIKKVAGIIGVTKSRVSMMPTQLAEETLKMPSGAIGLIAPFSSPRVFINSSFQRQPFLCFGVGRNDRTLRISTDELIKVVEIVFTDLEREEA
jgi:prolyl-tRNA editing enzyme YbaK/EbsC (Cys-tRNA(Pro) deacylase)